MSSNKEAAHIGGRYTILGAVIGALLTVGLTYIFSNQPATQKSQEQNIAHISPSLDITKNEILKTPYTVTKEFYDWYFKEVVLKDWRFNEMWESVVNHEHISISLKNELTEFYHEMFATGLGYDPIIVAQDYNEKFFIKTFEENDSNAEIHFYMYAGEYFDPDNYDDVSAKVFLIKKDGIWKINDIRYPH